MMARKGLGRLAQHPLEVARDRGLVAGHGLEPIGPTGFLQQLGQERMGIAARMGGNGVPLHRPGHGPVAALAEDARMIAVEIEGPGEAALAEAVRHPGGEIVEAEMRGIKGFLHVEHERGQHRDLQILPRPSTRIAARGWN